MPFDFLSVLVVRGGVMCLPTPPSWFSEETILNHKNSEILVFVFIHSGVVYQIIFV